eukprot:477889-Hanusia_phi.AAC.2
MRQERRTRQAQGENGEREQRRNDDEGEQTEQSRGLEIIPWQPQAPPTHENRTSCCAFEHLQQKFIPFLHFPPHLHPSTSASSHQSYRTSLQILRLSPPFLSFPNQVPLQHPSPFPLVPPPCPRSAVLDYSLSSLC